MAESPSQEQGERQSRRIGIRFGGRRARSFKISLRHREARSKPIGFDYRGRK